MKALHINCNYATSKLHQKMIEALVKAHVQNTVVIPRYYGAPSTIQTGDNEIVLECFYKNDRFLFAIKQNKILHAVKKAVTPCEHDIIHAYTLFSDGNCARNLFKKYGIPYVVAVRNTDVNTFFRWRILLRHRGVQILNDASMVFFLSNTYKKTVFERYIPSSLLSKIAAKSLVIPNGIDEFWLNNPPDNDILDQRREQLKRKEIKMIYAGRIDKNKNIPTVQRAMELLRSKGFNVSLVVVGHVDDSAEFARVQSKSFTTVKPEQPKETLIAEYRENAVFVMPSFHESFGLVYAEAMSQGLPVVYTKGQGFDGQFEEGEVGFSVDCHSAEDVALAIEKIIRDYESISLRCIDNAKKFNWADIAQQYVRIYKQVIKRPQ